MAVCCDFYSILARVCYQLIRPRLALLLLVPLAIPAQANANSDANGNGDSSATQTEMATSGVYTTAQAERGHELYRENCQSCHASNLRGMDPFPSITGSSFFSKWKGRPISELQQYIIGNMPLGKAGSLSDQVYADILAYWLSKHGYPAGSQPLAKDPANAPNQSVKDHRD